MLLCAFVSGIQAAPRARCSPSRSLPAALGRRRCCQFRCHREGQSRPPRSRDYLSKRREPAGPGRSPRHSHSHTKRTDKVKRPRHGSCSEESEESRRKRHIKTRSVSATLLQRHASPKCSGAVHQCVPGHYCQQLSACEPLGIRLPGIPRSRCVFPFEASRGARRTLSCHPALRQTPRAAQGLLQDFLRTQRCLS